MRKRLAVISIAVIAMIGAAAGSASAANAQPQQGFFFCPTSTGLHPLGLHCDFLFLT